MLCFHICFYLMQPWLHSFNFRLFFAKKFGNLALMVALVKLMLGAFLITPKLSTMRLISLAISWFRVVTSLVGPQTHRRHPQEPKILWMIFPLLEPFPPTSQEIHPQLDAPRLACPLFLSLAHSKGELRNAHPHSIWKTNENRCA